MFKKIRISEHKNRLFLNACKNGDLDQVKKLINKKQLTWADPMYKDGAGLVLAAQYGHEDVFNFLDRFGYVDDLTVLSALCEGPSLRLLRDYLCHFVESENPYRDDIIAQMMRSCVCHNAQDKLAIFLEYPLCSTSLALKIDMLHTAVRIQQAEMVNYLYNIFNKDVHHGVLAWFPLIFTEETIHPFMSDADNLNIMYHHGYDIPYAVKHGLHTFLSHIFNVSMRYNPSKTLEQISHLPRQLQSLCFIDDAQSHVDDFPLHI